MYPIYNHNWKNINTIYIYRGADKSLARPGRKQATATFIIIIGGILVLYIYITRLTSNEIFSTSNKIHREIGRAKNLSAPRYFPRAGKIHSVVTGLPSGPVSLPRYSQTDYGAQSA